MLLVLGLAAAPFLSVLAEPCVLSAALFADVCATAPAPKTKVTFRGKPVRPVRADISQTWLYACDGEQMLLTGVPGRNSWRAVCTGGGWKIDGKEPESFQNTAGYLRGTIDPEPFASDETAKIDRRIRDVFFGNAVRAALKRRPPSVGTEVACGGVRVHPSPGSATGLWFYEKDGNQLLLIGRRGERSWRAVVAGGDWTIDGQPLAERTNAAGYLRGTIDPARMPYDRFRILPNTPQIAPAIAREMIVHDWRCRDGLDTPCESRALDEILYVLRSRARETGVTTLPPATGDMKEWLALHEAIRAEALKKLPAKPILFVKAAHGIMSHQLTQVLGWRSRPGGGLFVLEEPGRSMKTRDVTPPNLKPGSFSYPDLSFDGKKMLFSYCDTTSTPVSVEEQRRIYLKDPRPLPMFHIYEAALAGGPARALTSKPGVEDYAPIYLPDGDVFYCSTMRGGFHRCGTGPCPVYTTSRMGPNGEDPHTLSWHETHEWTPALLHDGRVLYTRWDYTDRNGVLYQQLWASRQNGTGVRIVYGNNTWNPDGFWEARPVPGSKKIMGIGGPHHAMSAGTVILLDPDKGVDFFGPLTRLTPEVRVTESESDVRFGPPNPADIAFDYEAPGFWHGAGISDPNRNQTETVMEKRWPGLTYKSPWPFTETEFLTSFSFEPLYGEPGGNPPNGYGLYFCDAHGNRELLYRDPYMSSLWARPVEARPVPPTVQSPPDKALAARDAGTFLLSDVSISWPGKFPEDRPITALRIFRALPKETPDIDSPKMGAGLGSIGRDVLGTVPVEKDGSAYFELPARTPVYFQALDKSGRAIQTMRSIVYLQPGERESCIGCHEDRHQAPPAPKATLAAKRAPSVPKAGPVGSRPFNFVKLVQPVLDRHCVKCHDGSDPKRPSLKATRTRQWKNCVAGWTNYDNDTTESFCTLIKHVRYSSWAQEPRHNDEPLTYPLTFGAIPSPLTKRLDAGHGGVKLTPEERERLDLWMDSNGAMWGTYDRDKQWDY